jgi:ElaB/YqjD/DUF883 family membrane-anchored ribosome-binding protein
MGEEIKRTTEEIRREIERARERLANDVSALEVEVKQQLEWRTHVRTHPMAFVGGAFAIGFVVGIL